MTNETIHKHHVIPRHEWKRRFGTFHGFNAPDNVVWLTIEQHAQVHQLLHEMNKSWEDQLAYRFLSGLIGKEEAVLVSQQMAGKKWLGRKHSVESKRRMSLSKTGIRRAPFSERQCVAQSRGTNSFGAKFYKIKLPNKEIVIIRGLKLFCKMNKLAYSWFCEKGRLRGYEIIEKSNKEISSPSFGQ